LENFEPFTIHIDNFEIFKNATSSTLYLAPTTDRRNALEDLYKTVAQVFPPEKKDNFKAHIGVGFFRDKNEAGLLQTKYQQSWKPIEFKVKEIYLLTHKAQDEPFGVREVVALGKEVTEPHFVPEPE